MRLHGPTASSVCCERANQGNGWLGTLSMLFSYFFNTFPLSPFASLLRVLAS